MVGFSNRLSNENRVSVFQPLTTVLYTKYIFRF